MSMLDVRGMRFFDSGQYLPSPASSEGKHAKHPRLENRAARTPHARCHGPAARRSREAGACAGRGSVPGSTQSLSVLRDEPPMLEMARSTTGKATAVLSKPGRLRKLSANDNSGTRAQITLL